MSGSLNLDCSSRVVTDGTQERGVDLIDALVPIHLSQLVLLSVVVEHLDGVSKEDDQPPAHRFSAIIRPLVEATSIQITSTSHFRRSKCDMVDMLMSLAEDSAC